MSESTRDEFHRLRTAYLRLRAALRDPTTNLYTHSLYFDEIRGMLGRGRSAGVLWIGLGDRRLVESVYGWEAYDRLISEAAVYLGQMRGTAFPQRAVLSISGVRGDAFTVFVPASEGRQRIAADELAELARKVRSGLEQRLAESGVDLPSVGSTIRLGASLLEDNPFHRFERCVYQALEEARALAERPRESEHLAWLAEMQRLLREEDVSPVYQPVVRLEDGEAVGVEAYSRGPEGSMLAMPRVMFSLGRQAGVTAELDRLCRRRTLEGLRGVPAPALLFLNTTAESLVDPDWRGPQVLELLNAAGLTPGRIVLELPESGIAGDAALFREALTALRSVGYRLSLDDVGSSTRSVELIEELRPDFVKFDLSLVRGTGGDLLRRELVKSLVRLAERAGAVLVAERVETEDERRVLLDCGARWGQGYLFAAESASATTGTRPGRPEGAH